MRYAASRLELAEPWPKDDNAPLGLGGMSDEEMGKLIRGAGREARNWVTSGWARSHTKEGLFCKSCCRRDGGHNSHIMGYSGSSSHSGYRCYNSHRSHNGYGSYNGYNNHGDHSDHEGHKGHNNYKGYSGDV